MEAALRLLGVAVEYSRHQPVSTFYGLQAVTLLILWVGVRLGGQGLDFFRFGMQNRVALKPSWLPRQCFQWLLRDAVYLPCAYGLVPAFVAAAMAPDVRAVRIGVAIVVAIYHLGECSRTSSHRDYPMLYNVWALALLPGRLPQAVAFGLTVHFVSSSGLAKLVVAGPSWVDLRPILTTFGAKDFQAGGPMSPMLNRFVVRHPVLAKLCGLATLVLECVAAPLVFITPPEYRLIFCFAMLVLHAAIMLLQSAAIGIFFIPNVASYFYGFSAPFPVYSAAWWCAVGVWLLVTAPVLCCKILPEDWPLTPLALFPWSPTQWDALHAQLVTGDTRLVVGTASVSKGVPVVELNYRTAKGEAPPDGPVVFDAWSRLFGVTTLQTKLLKALDLDGISTKAWDVAHFTQEVEAWLQSSGRLVDLSSGCPLSRAFFVRVTHPGDANCSNSRAHGTIGEVLCEGTPPERRRLLEEEATGC